jgi:hypothetical protein
MSNFPNIVYISSDSSSEETIYMSSDSSSEESGWACYFPPCATSSSSRKPKKKVATPTPPSLGFYSSSSDDDETYTLSKEFPKALTQALGPALSIMKKIPVPEKTVLPTKPAKQVLGLPCPRKWNGMQEQPRGVHKTMLGYKGKGKEAME